MEVTKEEKHFVLVHGMSHGAWCWYKLIPLLKKAGHRITALDMAASGINMQKIEEVQSFEQYSQPLLDFMLALPDYEKVILVGHSLGGINIALAMENYPQKISAAIFLAAFLPDTINQPSFVLDKWLDFSLTQERFGSQFLKYGPPEKPLKAVLFNRQSMQDLYCLSPAEDFELAMTLLRQGSTFITSLAKANKFSNNGYGSVRRVYIISKEDRAITEDFERFMIENSGVTEVIEIEGADHMTMLSQPERLCDCLTEM